MAELQFDEIDRGKRFDWGKTSADYDRYRPGPPDSFYTRLLGFGLGQENQQILDLATGTGLLARRFALQGANVSGVDISPQQIQMARQAGEREKVDIDFRVADVVELPFADNSFDLITANQCWIYFDSNAVLAEAKRLLKPEGQLVISHFSFMPRMDEVVQASEELVLRHNPDWNGADWDGYIKAEPGWCGGDFELAGYFMYDEQITFDHAGWRGRMRALRGISASLNPEKVDAFDTEHRQLLEAYPEELQIWHRIHAQIFRQCP